MTDLRRSLLLACILCPVGSVQAQEYGAQARVNVRAGPGATTLEVEQARTLPGSLGEPARALSNLPGVARAAYDSGELVIWGSPASESRIYLDGVELPWLFHPAGIQSAVHPMLLSQVSLLPAAFNPAHGRGLGGVVELRSTQLTGNQAHGLLQVDPIAASLSTRVRRGVVSAQAGGRYSYLDSVLAWHDGGLAQLLAVPSSADVFAKLSVDTAPRTRWSASWVENRDRLVREVPAELVATANRDVQERADRVGYVILQHRYADGARVLLTAFLGKADTGDRSEFGGVPFALEEHVLRLGARGSYTRTFSAWTVALGFDLLSARTQQTRSGDLTLPAREGDPHVFGQRPSDEVSADEWRTSLVNLAPHGSVQAQLGPLSLALGLRLELYARSVNRALPTLPGIPAVGRSFMNLYPEPRVEAVLNLHPKLRMEARGAIQHQPPAASDLSVAFGTPGLAPSRALVGSVGPSWDLPWDITGRFEGYAKALSNLAHRSDAPTPAVAQALRQHGDGVIYGASAFLQRQVEEGVGFLASYGLSRSTRAGADGAQRLFDLDQTHILSASVSHRRGGLLVSVRFRYATGSPRTPVRGVYLDSKTGSHQPLLGPVNSARLPDFMQLDAHGEYAWRLGAMLFALYADVLNATARANVERVAYDDSYSRRRDLQGVPLLALAGVRLGF